MSQPAVKPVETFHAPAAALPTARQRLSQVVKGKIDRPPLIVLYGTDGVGKSTFAANAPKPIFIGAENGTDQLDVARMPRVSTWQDILESVDELGTQKHEYKTLVLDSADWAEPMLWKELCRRHGKKDIEAFGYSKGYNVALDDWAVLLSKLERARDASGMGVIVLAHSIVRTFKNPFADGDFDRYEMSLHPKAAGKWRQWADCVFFATYEQFAREVGGRAKGVTTGARVVHTERGAAFDAKNRFNLPEVLPLDYAAFAAAVEDQRPADPKELKAKIDLMIPEVKDPATLERVQAAVTAAGTDATMLKAVVNRLSATIHQQYTPTET